MESQEPAIEEKLVPFVEGALAEADRREVLQALPNYPALNHEVKQLRETILLLRTQAAQGLTYHSSVETPAEQVIDYVLQGDQWSRQASRQFQLQMLESGFLADEVALLRELEQELQQKVDAPPAVPPMSQALRASIQEAYGKPPEDPAWKRSMAVMLAWMSGLNLKVASAAVAGMAILVGGVSLGRYAHQQIQSSAPTKTVAVASPSASPASGGATPTVVAEAPKGQVALLDEKVHPEDLPRLSRLLWQKQVSHSYRDGQIFVAQGDVERAWSALSMNEKVASATALKTGPLPEEKDKKTNLLDGIIGALPDTKPTAVPAKAAPATPEAKPVPAPAPPPRATEVAIHLPAEPEVTRTENYAYYQESGLKDTVPAVSRAPEPAPVRQSSEASARPAVTRPAPPVVEERLRPTQMARLPEPDNGNVGSSRVGGVARSQPQVRRDVAAKETVAPPLQALSTKAAAPGGGRVEPAPAPAAVRAPVTAPVSQVASGQVSRVENQTNLKVEAEHSDPVPSNVVVTEALEQGGEDRAKKDIVAPPKPIQRAVTNQAPVGMRPVPKLPSASAADESNGAFQVTAGDPFEVAMLPIAKKLVEDMVGEAKVQMERQDDGHLLVTIRPARQLTPQEIEKLRKLIRTKLELKDEDTVVIRQP